MIPTPTDNSLSGNEDLKKAKRYDVSLQTRNFEIDLFWKRALFFWGFIAAAFIAFAAFSGDKTANPKLATVVSLFGLVCSLCWTLANRGSKFWQENWETQVEESEDEITGPLFKKSAPRQKKGWFSAQEYSVSKLAISLSDYLTVVWLGLSLYSGYKLPAFGRLFGWQFQNQQALGDCFAVFFLCFSFDWLGLTLVFCRSSRIRRDQPRGSKPLCVHPHG